ncbi:MAG: nitrile hydratase subunit beta [Actinobacteria bacterium]|nr:nitrile hydratase subunit beta [Actinomycetota bacterium]
MQPSATDREGGGERIGSHDVGGRRGYGAIVIEEGPPFSGWQGPLIGLTLTTMLRGLVQVDRWRARQEELHPVTYVDLPYFHRWLYTLERNLRLEGVLTGEEIEARMERLAANPDDQLPEHSDPEFVRAVEQLIAEGGPVVKEVPAPPRFAVGDIVRLRRISIERPGDEHTRLPGYAQGKRGEIARVNAAQALPDAMVADNREIPEHTYAVRLRAADLWPDAEPHSTVCVDAWESYIEPDEQTGERSS